MAAILGNAVMIDAYLAGIPGNGKKVRAGVPHDRGDTRLRFTDYGHR
jgi:hypothetical protein